MKRLLLGFLVLVGFTYFVEAVSKQEAFRLIHTVANDVRQQHIPQIKATVKKAMDEALSPEQTACVTELIPNMYKDLNMNIGIEMNGIRNEYRTKTDIDLEPVTEDEIKKSILDRLQRVLSWFPDRLKQMTNCIEA